MDEVRVNIYADEIQNRIDPITGDAWHYIGILIETLEYPLLPELTKLRYCGTPDPSSRYFQKNDRLIHWVDISSADECNICRRWLEYVLNPEKDTWHDPVKFSVEKSRRTYYSYILGINSTKLDDSAFDSEDDFNSKYNRFFRTALLYATKCYFPNRPIIIENIFHEEGSQRNNYYFPWHSIYKINQKERKVHAIADRLSFLSKDHHDDEKANILQLCDVILGISTSILHGTSLGVRSEIKKDLIDMYFPLFERLVRHPHNINSSYQHQNRIAIDFFPKDATSLSEWSKLRNQFYKLRTLRYEIDQSGQTVLL
jgi:hypothetical protein